MKALPLVAALLLGTASAASGVELTIWTGTASSPAAPQPERAEAYTMLYDKFQAENPDITLHYEPLAGGTEALQSILAAAQAGNLPDTINLDGFWVPRMVSAGILQPLDDLWSEEDRADFFQEAVDLMTIDGQIYAVHATNAWRGLYFDAATMETLGMPEGPSNWDELLELGEAASAAGINALMLPGSGTELTTLHMLSIFWAFGGDLVDDDGKPIFFEGDNRTALERTYQYYKDLVDNGLMTTDVATMDEGAIRQFFYSGETALVAQSSSSIRQIYLDRPDLEGRLNAVNYPMPDGLNGVPVLVGGGWGITASDPEQIEAAWKFVAFMTSEENLGLLNEVHGHLPIRKSIWESREYYSQNPLMRQFRGIFDSGGMRPRPPVPLYPAISGALSSQMADVLLGNQTPAEAVTKAGEAAMAEYDRMGSQ